MKIREVTPKRAPISVNQSFSETRIKESVTAVTDAARRMISNFERVENGFFMSNTRPSLIRRVLFYSKKRQPSRAIKGLIN